MSLYVQTNVSSLNSQRRLNSATKSLDTTYQRLSSGLRINSAKDDAAGLQISNRLTNQINGLQQGNRNANDGIALCQTMEGALDETTSMLQRIRTLAIQPANRLDGKGKVSFQVGAYAFDTLGVSMSNGFTLSGIYAEKHTTPIKSDKKLEEQKDGLYLNNGAYEFNCYTQCNAQYTIKAIDEIINVVDSKRAELGAIQNRMESTIRNQENVAENVSDARSRIRDADYAEEASNLSAQNIVQQAATSILTQANQRPSIAMSLLNGG